MGLGHVEGLLLRGQRGAGERAYPTGEIAFEGRRRRYGPVLRAPVFRISWLGWCAEHGYDGPPVPAWDKRMTPPGSQTPARSKSP